MVVGDDFAASFFRMGTSTNLARTPDARLQTEAASRTLAQLPVATMSRLASGTVKAAVPLAVYNNPLFAAAY
jgi:hypothetical protein